MFQLKRPWRDEPDGDTAETRSAKDFCNYRGFSHPSRGNQRALPTC